MGQVRARARVRGWQQLGFNIVFQTDFLFDSDLFPGVYEAIEGSPQLPLPLFRLNALPHVTSHITRWLCTGMLVVEEMGGFTSGGVNFDAKTHRA